MTAVSPTQLITDFVNAAFTPIYNNSVWPASTAIKGFWDEALANIPAIQSQLATILAQDGVQIMTLDVPPLPVPLA